MVIVVVWEVSTESGWFMEMMMYGKKGWFVWLVAVMVAGGVFGAVEVKEVAGRWSAERASAWYAAQPWLVGCNYIPATAINQLEMWQGDTFDPETIDRELALAEELGFNMLRVYLHDLVWEADEKGLYQRMDQFMDICAAHGIRPMFVFFDDCHHFFPSIGTQPQPVPEYHNSGWVTSPARDVAANYAAGKASEQAVARLKGYVQQTIHRFKDDSRVLMWELYNEPGRGRNVDAKGSPFGGGERFGDRSNKLLMDAWGWAREINPSQPISSCAVGCVGKRNVEIGEINSDVISFHSYDPPQKLESLCKRYAKAGRPAICTEYMARPNSTFEGSLPILKQYHMGACNWGFVAGKTGCVWPWSSRDGKNVEALRERGVVCTSIKEMPLPETWFHEIFYPDHTPYRQAEVDFIKQIIQQDKAAFSELKRNKERTK